MFIFWLTFNFVSFSWVQHTILLRQARKVSRLVTVFTIALVLGPCVLPLAASAAVDGLVAQILIKEAFPEVEDVDTSIIYRSVIGLALPSVILYYNIVMMICKCIFEQKVGTKMQQLPITLSTGFLVFSVVISSAVLGAYVGCAITGFE